MHKDKTYIGKDISQAFNNFFVDIGASVEAKIPKGSKSFREYLKDPNTHSIVFQHCIEEEVTDIIKGFSLSKAIGPYSIPTHIIPTNYFSN